MHSSGERSAGVGLGLGDWGGVGNEEQRTLWQHKIIAFIHSLGADMGCQFYSSQHLIYRGGLPGGGSAAMISWQSSTLNMTGRRFHRTMEVIPALPWKAKNPSVSRLSKLSLKQGDARGASEVRRRTSSIISKQFTTSALLASNHPYEWPSSDTFQIAPFCVAVVLQSSFRCLFSWGVAQQSRDTIQPEMIAKFLCRWHSFRNCNEICQEQFPNNFPCNSLNHNEYV